MRHDSRKYGKQSTHAESTKKSGRPSTHPLLTISGEGYFSISKLQSKFDDSVEGSLFIASGIEHSSPISSLAQNRQFDA